MKTIGKFKINGRFQIIGRGLVAIGDIIEGRVKVGSVITFNTGAEDITLMIGGVEMAHNISTKEYFVGLTFVYKDENELRKFQSLKLLEQVIDIMEEELPFDPSGPY